jgi:hypothetical protein
MTDKSRVRDVHPDTLAGAVSSALPVTSATQWCQETRVVQLANDVTFVVVRVFYLTDTDNVLARRIRPD